ncbi:hypothetical protein CRG98_022125 [Punica granatum]|uniref:Uncharacterized protein n=1 Tax=Punica granatum TaxID=22663 RepID=A0A2I0JMG1_PUNGR|nr:hypothetical protein CRG98_022125 [Punica granatum]
MWVAGGVFQNRARTNLSPNYFVQCPKNCALKRYYFYICMYTAACRKLWEVHQITMDAQTEKAFLKQPLEEVGQGEEIGKGREQLLEEHGVGWDSRPP